MEAEYIAVFTTAKHQIWLQNALRDLRIDILAALNTDNNGSIDLPNNPDKSKHIDINIFDRDTAHYRDPAHFRDACI